METLKIKKTGKSQYGNYILVDDGTEKGKFFSCTEQVSGFLSKQIPCEVEVQERGEKGIVTRVRVLNKVQAPVDNSMNEMDSPVEMVKPGIEPASNYKPAYSDRISDKDRQESIVTQSCIKGGLEMIRVANESREEKIVPTMENVLTYSQIIRLVYDKMLQSKDLPDY